MRVTILCLALALLLSPLALAQDDPQEPRRRGREDRYEAMMKVLQDLQAEVKQLRQEVQQLRSEAARSRTPQAEAAGGVQLRRSLVQTNTEIDRLTRTVVKGEAELAALTKALEKESESMSKAEQEINRLKKDLDSGKSSFTYGGRQYTRAQVEVDLKARATRAEAIQNQLGQAKQRMKQLQAQLLGDRKRLEGLRRVKRDLEAHAQRRAGGLQSSELRGEIDDRLSKQLFGDPTDRSQGTEETTPHADPVDQLRLKRAIDQADAQIEQMMKFIATNEVRLQAAEKKLAQDTAALEKQEQQIKTLRKALESKDSTYTFNGKAFTRAEVEKDLAARFKRFKAAESAIRDARQQLEAGQSKSKADRERLQDVLERKRQMEVLEQDQQRTQTFGRQIDSYFKQKLENKRDDAKENIEKQTRDPEPIRKPRGR